MVGSRDRVAKSKAKAKFTASSHALHSSVPLASVGVSGELAHVALDLDLGMNVAVPHREHDHQP